jgi:hypothetical protein
VTKTVQFKNSPPKEKPIERVNYNNIDIQSQKENFQIKFDNLLKLYEKKCMENDKLIEENDKKEGLILNLNFALKRANEQISSFKNINTVNLL